MWLARGLTTYKYENKKACLDKNLHQFLFLYLGASLTLTLTGKVLEYDFQKGR
jgi:hypothetical protein